MKELKLLGERERRQWLAAQRERLVEHNDVLLKTIRINGVAASRPDVDDVAAAGASDGEKCDHMLQIEKAFKTSNSVKAAISRIDNGTYGICYGCGDPIPIMRLTAQPDASRCLKCQEEFEAEEALTDNRLPVPPAAVSRRIPTLDT